MRCYEFETHRWSRVTGDEVSLECVVASRRNGWTHTGYQVRLYLKGHLLYQSCFYLTRKLAHDHADALLHQAFTSAHNAAVRRLPQLNEVVGMSRNL